MKAGWSSKRTDYRGQPYWCYQEQLHAMVRENVLMRHRRFEVFHRLLPGNCRAIPP
jgi:hypothetical protein